jgi:hypothetical protein
MQWWVHSAYESGGIVLLFSWAFWVIFSIVLHELSHGWAAIANSDNTPRELGHMTINPVVHMGWMSVIFFVVAGFAWGQMPTMPHRYRHERRGRVLVALAGPAMNVLLALLALTAAGAWASAIRTGRIAPAEHTAANVAECRQFHPPESLESLSGKPWRVLPFQVASGFPNQIHACGFTFAIAPAAFHQV